MTTRFIKLNATGEQLPDDATDHVVVRDTTTGLTWQVQVLAAGLLDHDDATKVCASLDLIGKTDWRLPTIQELLSIVDYTREAPAIDTDAFPDTPPNWTWSSTPVAGEPSYAWGVNFSDGFSYWDYRSFDGFVRAVRSGQ